jgi:hypothetical protein
VSDARKVRLKAGGLLAPGTDAPRDVPVDDVCARAYAHAALGDRVVVRLSPAPLAPATDLEMKTLGFAEGIDRGTVGVAQRRALGFPGWALVNDPARARFALDVVDELAKEARRAKSKPGHAKQGIDAIAERLGRSVPHFLPSFYEEAARIFVAQENLAYAAQMFEKAREAERVHGLTIDEDLRRESFLELALAGAVSTKSLAAYAKDLEATLGPEEAYHHYRELALRRTLGGMPPWASMARELRRLAKAAKKDIDAEERALIGELLGAPSLKRAARELWSSYEAPIVELARESASVRGTLLELFPAPQGANDDFYDAWLALLEKCGALEALRETDGSTPDAARPREGAAAWLAKWLAHVTAHWQSPGATAGTLALLESMAPRLRKDGAPLSLRSRWGYTLELDAVELALSLGIALAAPTNAIFDLRTWTQHAQKPGRGRDPVHVAADPAHREVLVTAVDQVAGQADFEAVAHGKKGLLDIRRAWLERLIAGVSDGSLVQLENQLAILEKATTAATYREIPAPYAALERAQVGPALLRTLRAGLIDELGWPALDAAIATHWPDPRVTLGVGGAFPYLCVYDHARVVVVGPEGEHLQHDLRVPKGAAIQALRYVQGQLLVVFHEPTRGWQWRGYWSSAPHDVFDVESYSLSLTHDQGVVLSDGSVSSGGRALSAGDRAMSRWSHHGAFVSDGTTAWIPEWTGSEQRLRELDLRTGERGRLSMPAWLEARAQEGSTLLVAASWMQPLPKGLSESPFGVHDGTSAICVRMRNAAHPLGPTRPMMEIEGIDGRRIELTQTENVLGLVSMPGEDRPRLLTSQHTYPGFSYVMWDADGRAPATRASPGPYHGGARIPLASGWWHYYRPRDPRGSRALRAITQETVDALLRAAGDGSAAFERAAESALSATLSDVSEPHLVRAIVTLVRHAAELAQRLETYRRSMSPTSAPLEVKLPTEEQLATALGRLAEGAYYHGGNGRALESSQRAAELFQRAERVDEVRALPGPHFPWERYVGRAGVMAWLAASFATTPDERGHLTDALRFFTRTPFGRGGANLRAIHLKVALDAPKSTTITYLESSSAVLGTIGGHDYWLRPTHHYYYDKVLHGLEHAPAGDAFRVPEGFTLEAERRIAEPLDEAWATRFVELLAQRGPVAWAGGVADELARRTGLPKAAAALLWIGLRGTNVYQSNFLDKQVRETLGLKTQEAKAARDVFQGAPVDALIDVYAQAVPEDPAALWAPLEGGEASVVARLAAAWNARFGRRASIDDALLAEVNGAFKLGKSLAMFADPDHVDLTRDRDAGETPPHVYAEPEGEGFTRSTLENVTKLALWLFAHLPVGHALRAQIPRVIERARARARAEGFAVSLGAVYLHGPEGEAKKSAIFQQVGGEPLVDGSEGRLAGAVRVVASASSITALAHPHRLTKPADWDHLSHVGALFASHGSYAPNLSMTLRALALLLREDPMDALLARIETTPVPDGGYETNPAASARDVLERVRVRLDLDEDAATLYLQTLALLEPSKSNVLTWNGWTSARYEKAAKALVQRELALTAKRARAGRSVFLPGGWEALKAPHPPFESWKAPLYETTRDAEGKLRAPLNHFVPLEPVHAIFERAWARVEQGDAPRYEEVR